MKVMVEVNNYQYGMAQFQSIKKQFTYKDEYIKEKHVHHVYLEFEPQQLNLQWLERLVNYRIVEVK